jgi:hypothetical protein
VTEIAHSYSSEEACTYTRGDWLRLRLSPQTTYLTSYFKLYSTNSVTKQCSTCPYQLELAFQFYMFVCVGVGLTERRSTLGLNRISRIMYT